MQEQGKGRVRMEYNEKKRREEIRDREQEASPDIPIQITLGDDAGSRASE